MRAPLEVAALSMIVAAASTLLFSLASNVELRTLDWRYLLLADAAAHDPDIVVVDIDQDSLDIYEELGITWPWPRELYAEVCDYLDRDGARAIVFDMLFSSASSWGSQHAEDQEAVTDDMVFGRRLEASGKVFLGLGGSTSQRSGDQESRFDVLRSKLAGRTYRVEGLAPPEYSRILLPVEELLRPARGVGDTGFRSTDNIGRRALLLRCFRDQMVCSLPFEIFLQLTGTDEVSYDPATRCLRAGDALIPCDQHGQMLLHYHGPGDTYKAVPAASVLANQARHHDGEAPLQELATGAFAGKIVLVGSTAPGLHDLHASPFTANHPGIEILATALDNLLNRDHLQEFGWQTALVLAFVLALGGALSARVRRAWVSFVLLAALVCGYFASALLCFDAKGWVLPMAAPLAAAVMSFACGAMLGFYREGRERRRVRIAFQHYLAPTVVDEVLRDPAALELGGQRRDLSVFFCDLVGFTTASENMQPEELVSLLNRYFTRMTEVIVDHHGGTHDKFIGDAIMAFWNAPLDQPDHSLRACLAASDCQLALAELNRELVDSGAPPLIARTGIHSGPALVGNLGSARIFEYTAIGDTVNLASRLEGANKQYGTRTLVTDEVVQAASGGDLVFRFLDRARVVGRESPAILYELVGRARDLDGPTQDVLAAWPRARDLYEERNWLEAKTALQALADRGDGASRVFHTRCLRHLETPPPAGWDGVFSLDAK